jgi:uncharacterized membrane protein
MTTRTHPAVDEYLARTQAALSDLPASQVEEIVEDIGPHLSETTGELGSGVTVAALTERLGTPEQYASELRAAGLTLLFASVWAYQGGVPVLVR